MENATKALIMAGAILITILLISVGILILRSTSGMEGQVDSVSKSSEVATFNSKFLTYIGENIPQIQVKSLVSNVNANNGNNTRKITIIGVPKVAGSTDMYDIGKIDSSFYKVSGSYDPKGYIQSIKITPKT